MREMDQSLDPLELDPLDLDPKPVDQSIHSDQSSDLRTPSRTSQITRKSLPPLIPLKEPEPSVPKPVVEEVWVSDHCLIPSEERKGNFPEDITKVLRSWLLQHLNHPYPTRDEKKQLADDTGLAILQVEDWFTNARRRTEALRKKRNKAPIRRTIKNHHKDKYKACAPKIRIPVNLTQEEPSATSTNRVIPLWQSSKKKTLQCVHCTLFFPDKTSLTKHLENYCKRIEEEKQTEWNCDKCGKTFNSASIWRVHIGACHSLNKPNTSIGEHIVLHSNSNRPFHCKHCGKDFETKRACLRHLNHYCKIYKPFKPTKPSTPEAKITVAPLPIITAVTSLQPVIEEPQLIEID